MQNQKGSKKRQSGKGQGSLGYALKALAAFLAILIVGIMQLSFSFAFDLAPTITLAETSHDPSLSQSILVANAFDPGDNSGLRWIKLFEDGSLKYEKNCAGSSTCALTAIITHSTAGWHSFYAKTQDKSGKTATSQTLRIYFEGANQPPQITSKNPSQNTFSISEASLSQSFSITASDPNGDSISYSWYVNNQQQSSSGNSFIWQVPNVDSNEVFNIAVIVSDGKASSGAGWSATVTDTAPENVDFSFSPSSPSVGQLVNFVASATAFDGISGFSWDFGDGSTASGQSVSHAYAVRGTYTVTLTARDADGDERSRTKTIIVRDTAAPQVIIYSPQDGVTYDSLPIQLEYSVSDDDGIEACWYVLNGGTPQNLPGCQNTTLNLANGAYNLVIYARDESQNVGSASVTFSVNVPDTEAPLVTLISPANGSIDNDGNVTVSYSVTDNMDTELMCYVWSNTTGVWEVNANQQVLNGSTSSYTFTGLQNGVYAWNVECVDDGGNHGFASSNYTFLVLLPPAHIVINEFESNNGSSSGDWIELYNPAASDVDVTGWYIYDGGNANKFTLSGIIGANDYMIINAGNRLNNAGENLTLYDNFDQVVDDVSYNFADTLGNDLCWARVPNGQDTNTLSDWQFQQCTRGFSNDLQLGVILESDSYARTVSKNVNATYIINITNTGNVWNNFALGVINYNGANVWLSTNSITLQAGQSELVELNVSSATPGNYVVKVYANSTINVLYNETQNITTTVINNAPIANNDYYETNEDELLSISAPAGVLANDNDTDSDALIAILVSDVSHGVLTLNQDGSFTYTPNANFNGIDSFSYVASDGMDNSNVAIVTINVTPANDAPTTTGIPDQAIAEDSGTTSVDISPYFSDVDGDTLTFSIIGENPAEVDCNIAGNNLEMTPVQDWYGLATCVVQADDGNGGIVSATVNINVTPINDAPVVTGIPDVTFDEDSFYDLLDLDDYVTDVDNSPDQLSWITTGNINIIITIDPVSHAVNFTAPANWSGTETVTFIATDPDGASGSDDILVTVNPVNDAPVAADDIYTTDEDKPLNIAAQGILTNDSDVDGDQLTALLVTDVSNGILTLNSDGSFNYTPNTNWFGTDSFTYVANDGTFDSNIATVTIIVNPVNDAPIANDDSAITDEDVSILIDVLANDSDIEDGTPTLDSIVVGPTNGTAVIIGNQIEYTPAANFYGIDTFTYQVIDSGGLTDTAIVTITVNPVNDAPIANDDSAITDEDVSILIDVLANDTDVEGPVILDSIITTPTNGTAVIIGNQINYTPNADWYGTDSFTYQINDSDGAQATAIVTITVNPVNDAPYLITSIPDVTFDEDSYNDSLDMTNYFADVDNATLVYSFTSNNSNVIVTFVGTRINITASPNWNGIAEVTFIASDGEYSANDTIIVTVNPVPDYGVSITATPSSQTVGLLVPAVYTITITNIGDTPDSFNLTVQNINNADQAILNATTTPMLNQGESYIASLTVSDSNPGIYVIDVIATSNSNTSISNTTSTTTNVTTTDSGWIYNSTVNDTFYENQSTGIFDNINDSIIKNFSTIKASAGGNFSEDILILDSNIDNSTIENSWLTAVNATASIINNSILTNCTVINATVKGIIASNCYLANGIYDPPQPTNNLTGSNLTNSYTYQSNVTYSNVSYSNITYSNVDNAIINEANITYSNVSNSTIESSNLTNSIVTDSEITNSTLTNSLADNSTISNSTLDNSTAVDSRVENSTLTDSAADSSTIIDCVLTGSNATGSELTACTLLNSNVTDSDLTNVTATNSTIVNTNLSNATLIDANITDGILYNGTITTENFTYNASNNTPLNLSNSSSLPSVIISITSSSPYMEDKPVLFNAIISGQFDTTDNITYEWDWTNDGTFDEEKINDSTASHTYSNPGNYVVKVKVTDVHGTSAWNTISFTVKQETTEEEEEGKGGGGGGAAPPAYVCGNKICESWLGENSSNCALDCAPTPRNATTPKPTSTPKTIQIKSDDGLLIITLNSGIDITDSKGDKVDPSKIKIEKITDLTLLPTLPQDVYLVRAYKFTPDVRFSEDVELIIKYNEGFAEGANLFIYSYDGGWKKIESVHDKEKKEVIALINSASIIGLFVDRLPVVPVTGGVIGWLKGNWHIVVIGLLAVLIVISVILVIAKRRRY